MLQFIEKQLNRHIYDSWFRPIRYEGQDDAAKILFLRAGQVTKDWVTLYYNDLLKAAADAARFGDYRFEWTVDEAENAEERFSEMPNPDFFQPMEKSFAAAATTEAPATQSNTTFSSSSQTNFLDLEPVENSLNPKYTFEKFVVGTSNQFAHAASLAAAETPGKTYNPLFIYGGVGLARPI